MLKLMADNDNSNIQANVNGGVETDQPASFGQSPNSSNPNTSILNTDSSTLPKPKVKKSRFKLIVCLLIIVALFGAATTTAFYIGKHKRIVVTAPVKKNPINLPPAAVVVAECTPGRGKQYIIPKDIPAGPIYDVKNSEVIAIEYVLGIKQLITNSDNFSSTILQLTAAYPVDHFNIVPVQPKPTDTDQYIQLIVFVVSKSEANSITCT
jgi:hypothetical protein